MEQTTAAEQQYWTLIVAGVPELDEVRWTASSPSCPTLVRTPHTHRGQSGEDEPLIDELVEGVKPVLISHLPQDPRVLYGQLPDVFRIVVNGRRLTWSTPVRTAMSLSRVPPPHSKHRNGCTSANSRESMRSSRQYVAPFLTAIRSSWLIHAVFANSSSELSASRLA